METQRPVVVLHVLEDLGVAGSEGQTAALILRSDAARFRHIVCACSQEGHFAGVLRRAGVAVHTLDLPARSDLARATVRLYRLVRRVRPDILHATLYRAGVASRIVGRLYRIPVVTSLVNTTYEPEWRQDNPRLTPWKVWVSRTIDGVTGRWWGAAFVAISASVKTSAIRRLGLPPDRIVVIPRGLPAERPAQGAARISATRAALGLDAAFPFILSIGRLVPQKGQRYAIQAMRHVLATFPRARLLVAGEGWLRKDLESLITQEGLGGHVTLLGEREDIDVLLQIADVFVFPSLYEGFGNALLEAMGAGKACVVSDIPTLREVTGEGKAAVLVGLRSPQSLGTAIIRLANNAALREALGRQAAALVRERYDIRDSVEAHQALYRRLVAPSAAAQGGTGESPMADVLSLR